MTDLRDALRRLRRDAPAAPAPPAHDGPAEAALPPAWLRERLAAARPRDAAARTAGAPRDLALGTCARGEFAYREERWPVEHRHGALALGDAATADGRALALAARDDACGELDLRACAFLDVETTGLSGGAGTQSFLVALGSFEGDGFALWQGFLRGPHEEPALLDEVARRIGRAAGVVSFFGKSFDRHRLEDKMRVVGVAPPFEGRPHLDLYWPVQRLYGAALEDGRLATAERALLGLERRDDLPGSRAPEAWFDFLAGRPHRLEDVFRHNRDDVLSLVGLAAHVGSALREGAPSCAALPGPAGARAAGWARLLGAAGRVDEALAWAERALERGAPDARGLSLLRAELADRGGEPLRALELYEELCAGEDEVAARALLAVAKLAEHRARDVGRAQEACRRLRRLAESRLVGRPRARALDGLERREARLASKAAPRG